MSGHWTGSARRQCSLTENVSDLSRVLVLPFVCLVGREGHHTTTAQVFFVQLISLLPTTC